MKEYLNFWDNPSIDEQKKLIAGPTDWSVSENMAPHHWSLICTPYLSEHLREESRVLELGCGVGRILKYLANNTHHKLYGRDISDNMIKSAQEYLKETDVSVSNVKSGLGKNYDLIYSFLVFQHMPTRAIVRENLRQMYKALKYGGHVRVQTHKGIPHTEDKFGGFHGHFFPSIGAFEEVFTEVGFHVVERQENVGWKDWLWITARKPLSLLQ